MEVNQEVLKKLICSVCEEHLSVGPVQLLQNDQSVCGRCSAPDAIEELALRNLPYEYLAEQLLFPCQNARHGCKVKCVFGEAQKHEENCEFRQYICCISEARTCTWFGPKHELLQHCKDTHPQHVVQNPAKFEHDIFKSSVGNYLMTAFQMLFLIHTKVCLTNKKIYHCVRLLGDSGNIGNFDYSLVITNEDNNVSKKGVVARQGCLAIKEDDSLAIGINILLGIFTNFKGIIFTLTVKSLIKKPGPLTNVAELYFCQCSANVTYTAAYVDKGKWFCSNCIDNKHVCSNVECSFEDTEDKLDLHETYYCSYQRECPICLDLIDVTLEQHYKMLHTDITYVSGQRIMEQINRTCETDFIITSEFGRLHCRHILFSSDPKFYINVCSPIDSGNLRCYTCELQLQNPVTGLTLRKILPLFDHDSYLLCDWQLKMAKEEINQYVYNNKVNISVTITKTKY